MANNVSVKGLFPLYFKKTRVAIIPGDFLKILIHESKRALGESAAESLAYHLGVVTGRKFYEMMVETEESPDIDYAAEYFSKFMLEFGWGKLTNITVEEEYIEVCIDDLFECSIQETVKPASRFTVGFIEGLVSRLLNTKVVVKEIMCKATGDFQCIFRIYPLK